MQAHGVLRVGSLIALVCATSAALRTPVTGEQRLPGFHVREAFSDREDGWNDHGTELWFAPAAFRLDLWNHGDKDATWVSLIIAPDDRARVLEIHHSTMRFDRCPLETFSLVQGVPLGAWPFDPQVAHYETEPFDDVRQVASWSTRAVAVREPGPEEEWVAVPGNPRARVLREYRRSIGRLWLTEDTGISLRELRRVLESSLKPYADAGGSAFVIHSMWLQIVLGLDGNRLSGVPDGIPVAFELERLGELGVTGELRSVERVRLPATLFEVPIGYARSDLCPGG